VCRSAALRQARVPIAMLELKPPAPIAISVPISGVAPGARADCNARARRPRCLYALQAFIVAPNLRNIGAVGKIGATNAVAVNTKFAFDKIQHGVNTSFDAF
jgi:hypothetical protein